jgi:hypothetical protein
MRPTFRSRAAQPSRRRPIPGLGPGLVDKPLHAEHRVQLEKGDRRRGIVEIHLSLLDLVHQGGRQRGGIDLQPDGQRRLWADPRADTAELGSRNRAMKLKRATPEFFAAERIEPERLATLVH